MSDQTQKNVALFDKHAERYQEKYMDVSGYHDSLDQFCQSVSKASAHLLDIACGPGNICQYLLKKRPDFKILGIDLAPKMLDLAKANNPTATFQLMNGTEIASLSQKFAGIICGFGLPYFSKEEALQLIADTALLLNPEGVLYLSTMEGDYNSSGYASSSSGDSQAYTYFHEANYLEEALQQNGFQEIKIQRQDFIHSNGTSYVDLIILARLSSH